MHNSYKRSPLQVEEILSLKAVVPNTQYKDTTQLLLQKQRLKERKKEHNPTSTSVLHHELAIIINVTQMMFKSTPPT